MLASQIIEPEWLLPFEGMAVGDSFFIPTLRPSELIYAIDSGAKRAKFRVRSYVTTKDNLVGVRTWRVG